MTASIALRPTPIESIIARSDQIDRFANQSGGIDRWCSSADWIISTHQAFEPDAEPITAWSDRGALLLCRHQIAGMSIIAGLESVWGFACPVLGPDPRPVLGAGARSLAQDSHWVRLVIPGLTPGSSRATATVDAMRQLGRAGASEPTIRRIADLSDGFDAWFGRRSSRFRRNLRRAERNADSNGISIETSDHDVMRRVLAVESRSWKGQAEDGVLSPTMTRLYGHLTERLGHKGRLRAVFARHGDRDVGFLLGAVGHDTYRGLQLSYDADFAAASLGHLLQLHEVRWCGAVGIARYDLGMDMEYKVAWADGTQTTAALIIDR